MHIPGIDPGVEGLSIALLTRPRHQLRRRAVVFIPLTRALVNIELAHDQNIRGTHFHPIITHVAVQLPVHAQRGPGEGVVATAQDGVVLRWCGERGC